MKKSVMALAIIAGLFAFTSASAQGPNLILKADGKYQFAGIEGYRTHCLGFGGTVEKLIGYSQKSFFFTVDYLYRSDSDGPIPIYDDILYFALGGKQYASYETPMNGGYIGLMTGIGIPKDEGVFWDFDFLVGYQLIKGKIAVDLNAAIGFGVLSFWADYPGGTWRYYFDGFVFRPGLSIGFAL